jgi:hypothetical protein
MLFGHLASRFATHPENLATEAVAFIVDRSPAMREALRRLAGRTGVELPPLMTFRSQAGDDQGNIPDLIGLDATGGERLVIENKFWAGLTENQPAGYLDRLPIEGGAVLLFVVPSKRLPIVWSELERSATNRGRDLPHPEQLPGDGDFLFARVPPSIAVAATTWNAVLDRLDDVAGRSGDASAPGDIAQLRSLCDVMDNEAFLPVRVEELTNLEVPRRLIGLADLVDDLSKQAVALGIADLKGLRETHGWYSAGRYLRIGPAGAWLGVDHEKWSRYGITPLWIRFGNTPFGRATFVLRALKAWAPPRLFQQKGRALIPLTVLPDVMRETVLENLLGQLTRLHAALHSAAAVTVASPQ